MMPTRVVLVRHGETPWNIDSRIQGHTDIPLNELGRWQADQVARALSSEPVDAVVSSDLQRARDTADAIARAVGVPLQLDAGLRERHFGRLEGLTHHEIHERWPDDARRWRDRDPAYGPEGGETLSAFSARCVGALTRLAQQHAGRTLVVVAHGGVLDCFYRAATGTALSAPRTWPITNASIHRLMHEAPGFRLEAWADTRHLQASSSLDEATDGVATPA